ncbi:hypothetical protein KIPB_004125 [Kipferlia bialata]|uniref:Uncharacterized protein n=1 Tax=Kipferlia bialata TaxID=797122 RepID=A0A9K3GHX8_9EUKA|nr:hypothetical protein KIPB_004125 [Kipferlia bialata]|eukprot:g4125.t1
MMGRVIHKGVFNDSMHISQTFSRQSSAHTLDFSLPVFLSLSIYISNPESSAHTLDAKRDAERESAASEREREREAVASRLADVLAEEREREREKQEESTLSSSINDTEGEREETSSSRAESELSASGSVANMTPVNSAQAPSMSLGTGRETLTQAVTGIDASGFSSMKAMDRHAKPSLSSVFDPIPEEPERESRRDSHSSKKDMRREEVRQNLMRLAQNDVFIDAIIDAMDS